MGHRRRGVPHADPPCLCHLNKDVLALLAKAYSTGLADGSRIGRYAAKAEIRKALEIA